MKPSNESDPPVAREVAGAQEEIFAARMRLEGLEERRQLTAIGMGPAILTALPVTLVISQLDIGWAWTLLPGAAVLLAAIVCVFARRAWLSEINAIRAALPREERRDFDEFSIAIPMPGDTPSETAHLNWQVAMEAYMNLRKRPHGRQ